jgi:hypothetical protein
MQHSATLALLLLATAFAGGCVHCSSAPEAIPVRRLPDEVLHACPPCPPAPDHEVAAAKDEKQEKKVVARRLNPFAGAEAVPPAECAPAGGCAVFYTGGALGSGEYPLRPGLRVTEAIAVARGPILPGCCRSAPSRVTVLRRLGCGQQLAIRVDLNEALRDPRENIPVWPGDMILTSETACEAACRALGCVFHCGPKVATGTLTGYPLP